MKTEEKIFKMVKENHSIKECAINITDGRVVTYNGIEFPIPDEVEYNEEYGIYHRGHDTFDPVVIKDGEIILSDMQSYDIMVSIEDPAALYDCALDFYAAYCSATSKFLTELKVFNITSKSGKIVLDYVDADNETWKKHVAGLEAITGKQFTTVDVWNIEREHLASLFSMLCEVYSTVYPEANTDETVNSIIKMHDIIASTLAME